MPLLGVAAAALGLLAAALPAGPATASPPAGPSNEGRREIGKEIHHDVSPPLRDMKGPGQNAGPRDIPLRMVGASSSSLDDPVIQNGSGPPVAANVGLGFATVGHGDYGFVPRASPADPNGAVGAAQYVQWVNTAFAVFDKSTGALIFGPAPGNALWSGFGGGCETNNDGDPIAQYDKLADRWVMTQFSVSTRPFLECVAVSTTPDATGPYNRYAFSYGDTEFPDYPKVAVWPDAYYISFNIFPNLTSFGGAKVCAYDRVSMLAGAPATQQCFQLSSSHASLLPSDLDGSSTSLPPEGSPNYFLGLSPNSLNLWKFHVDWVNPANTTLAGPTLIPVAPFVPACLGNRSCVSQPGTAQVLDAIGDRLMYRLAYRNRGGVEALVANHSVQARDRVGLRWYELRLSDGSPSVFQQGTYAPDSDHRWMGSIAMDRAGNIALGYSVSGPATFPSIRYTGRVPEDRLGTMGTEKTIVVGGGSQTGISRWGDYSSMTIDPADQCTFYYTSQYLRSTGSFNWSTRTASFRFPNCE